MTPRERHRRRDLPYLIRIVLARPRLCASGAVFIALALLLPAAWQRPTRLLVAWNLAVGLYLVLVYTLMARSQISHIREHSAMEDEGRLGILTLTAASALASLGAIFAELGSSLGLGESRRPDQLLLAVLTILVSWTFIQTIFALHYAHEFYSENEGRGGGLIFPGDEPPDYWDFVYFSFVVGMTSQVSDVGIACKPIRRTVACHGVLSFVFNTALLALTVNIAAGLI